MSNKLVGVFAGLVAVVLIALAGVAPAGAVVNWTPTPMSRWQWQLSSVPTNAQIDALTSQVDFWDIDGFDASKATVAYIHSKGDKAVCYISAGSWEDWRPDASQFPAASKGNNLDGWPGEKWLDTRVTMVRTLMTARAQNVCYAKGFDAIEWDNVDAYSNNSGFPLTAATQLDYNKFLAQIAHNFQLAAALKNDVDQLSTLQPFFDFAINEECQAYNECGGYSAFKNAGKFIGQVEYSGTLNSFCPQATAGGRSAMKKTYALTSTRTPCP